MNNRTFAKRLAALEALEVQHEAPLTGATLADVWPLLVYGAQVPCIWHDFHAPVIQAGVESFAKTPSWRAAVEAHYRAGWPELELTYADIQTVCRIATEAREAGRVLIPLWVEDVDELLRCHTAGVLAYVDGRFSHLDTHDRINWTEATRRKYWWFNTINIARIWLHNQQQERPQDLAAAVEWLHQIRPELVALQGANDG